jgi:hypothetical protein
MSSIFFKGSEHWTPEKPDSGDHSPTALFQNNMPRSFNPLLSCHASNWLLRYNRILTTGIFSSDDCPVFSESQCKGKMEWKQRSHIPHPIR